MPIWKKSKSKKRVPDPKPSTPVRPEIDVADPVPPVPGNPFRLGKEIKLKGELTASADVEIQGEVKGKVELDEASLVVADGGRVIADITARDVVVRGDVVGNIKASDKIVIESTGSVLGDVCAPSIQLDDGSRFTGSINRDSAPAKVTGRLQGGEPESPPAPARKNSTALARRTSFTDRRGNTRPWGAASNRRSSRPEPEPTTTA